MAVLKTFSEREYPLLEITPGATYLDDRRKKMTLKDFADALETQRRTVLEYLNGLTEAITGTIMPVSWGRSARRSGYRTAVSP